MRRASCAARRRAPTKVIGSPGRWAAWSAAPWEPVSAAPWARSEAYSEFPIAAGTAAIAAAATTTATATSGVIADVIPGCARLGAGLRCAIAHRGIHTHDHGYGFGASAEPVIGRAFARPVGTPRTDGKLYCASRQLFSRY